MDKINGAPTAPWAKLRLLQVYGAVLVAALVFATGSVARQWAGHSQMLAGGSPSPTQPRSAQDPDAPAVTPETTSEVGVEAEQSGRPRENPVEAQTAQAKPGPTPASRTDARRSREGPEEKPFVRLHASLPELRVASHLAKLRTTFLESRGLLQAQAERHARALSDLARGHLKQMRGSLDRMTAAARANVILQGPVFPETAFAPVEARAAPLSVQALVLANPAESGGTIHYLVDGEVFSLHPGETHRLEPGKPYTVEFHRGGSFGDAVRTLERGRYEFVVGPQGWKLNAVSRQKPEKAAAPPTRSGSASLEAPI